MQLLVCPILPFVLSLNKIWRPHLLSLTISVRNRMFTFTLVCERSCWHFSLIFWIEGVQRLLFSSLLSLVLSMDRLLIVSVEFLDGFLHCSFLGGFIRMFILGPNLFESLLVSRVQIWKGICNVIILLIWVSPRWENVSEELMIVDYVSFWLRRIIWIVRWWQRGVSAWLSWEPFGLNFSGLPPLGNLWLSH